MGKFTIKVVNNRNATNLNMLLTVSGRNKAFDGGSMKIGTSITVSDFFAGGGSISAEVLDSCRLYVGYGALPAQPDPNRKQYYGWIEFSKANESDDLWINLSNVDIVGLPLALDGVSSTGDSFSLGYKKSISDIITDLKNNALTGTAPAAAIKQCDNGSVKIIAPNIQFPAYKSYQPYLDELTGVKAKVTIHTDTPIAAPSKVFTGSFSDSDTIVSLTDGTNKFEVLKSQFTTEYLYRCDGGTVVYNGVTVNMNRDDDRGKNAPVVYTNSLFRNLCTGINEGYFTPTGENDSSKFLSQTPFKDGRGNIYAAIIHAASNSYGYPYADGNLKTLIKAGGESTVTMTIMKDDETGH